MPICEKKKKKNAGKELGTESDNYSYITGMASIQQEVCEKYFQLEIM